MPMVNGCAVKKTVARDLAIRTVFAQAEAIFHDARYVRRARLQATDAGYPRHALAEVGPVKWGKSIDKRWDASSASALPHFGPGDELVESLSAGAAASTPSAEARAVAWDGVPPPQLPGYHDGDLPEARSDRKQEQVAALAFHIDVVLAAWRGADTAAGLPPRPPVATIVDFGAGSGHLGLCLAHLFPSATVILVEPRPFSVETIERRLAALRDAGAPLNLECYAGGIEEWARLGRHFDVGVGLHCCGSLTDAVQQLCLDRRAAYVICPCCYGQAAKARGDDGARSVRFAKRLTADQMRCIASGADFAVNADMSARTLSQRSFAIAKRAAFLCDADRVDYAAQRAYRSYVASLRPILCSPKSNVIAGWPTGSEPRDEGVGTALVAVRGDDMVAKLASYASGRWGSAGKSAVVAAAQAGAREVAEDAAVEQV